MDTVMKYSRWRRLAFALSALTTVIVPASAFALPLPWTAPWTVAFPGRFVGNTGAATLAAFGTAAGQVHGQINPLPNVDDPFKARAQASASADWPDSDFASAMVTFSRPFLLPPGTTYDVNMSAVATGGLVVSDPTTDSASMSAMVCIGPAVAGVAAFLCINNADHPNFAAAAPPLASGIHTTGLIAKGTVGFPVAPGLYEMRGFLSVAAATNPGFLGSGLADVQYFFSFEGTGGYEPKEADPAPEPSALALVIGGVGAVVSWRRRRRTAYLKARTSP
jgi:hypothetical protein